MAASMHPNGSATLTGVLKRPPELRAKCSSSAHLPALEPAFSVVVSDILSILGDDTRFVSARAQESVGTWGMRTGTSG
eukprot:354751-Chlamydomonas_euryale.AAC.3